MIAMTVLLERRAVLSVSRVREVIDPLGTLPVISLLRNPGFTTEENILYTGVRARSHKIRHQGRVVGSADIATYSEGDWHFSYIGVDKKDPAYARGIGLAAYLLVIESAHAHEEAFATDYEVSADAKKMWDRFVSAGIAIVLRPLEIDDFLTESVGELRYSGDIRIPPL